MITTTTNFINGKDFCEISVVKGNCCTFIGGEFRKITQNIREAKDIAYDRMIEEANKYHANAIIDVKMMTEHISDEMLLFAFIGTAVKIIELKENTDFKITSL